MGYPVRGLVIETTIGVITLAANIVLLAILGKFKTKKLKETTYYFMLFETVNHTLMGTLIPIRPYVSLNGCSLYAAILVFAGLQLVTGYLLLAIDSILPLIYPYTHHLKLTTRFAKLLLAMSTVFWGVVSTLCFFVKSLKTPRPGWDSCIVGEGNITEGLMIAVSVLIFLIMFTSVILQALTARIIQKLKSTRSEVTNMNNLNCVNSVALAQNVSIPVNTARTRQERLVHLLLVSLTSTFLCWTPTLVLVIVMDVMSHLGLPTMNIIGYRRWFSMLIWLDSVLYPTIVLAMSSDLRATAKAMFCRRPQCMSTVQPLG